MAQIMGCLICFEIKQNTIEKKKKKKKKRSEERGLGKEGGLKCR
jgi:hypothetical protein